MQNDPDREWPESPHPEYDGYVWETGPEPSEEDREWAANNLNHDGDDEPPDDYYDALADEAAALDRLQRGLL